MTQMTQPGFNAGKNLVARVLSYSTIVLYIRDIEGVGAIHDII